MFFNNSYNKGDDVFSSSVNTLDINKTLLFLDAFELTKYFCFNFKFSV